MDEYETLSHTTWDCKYHIVFIPKYRRKTLYQELHRHLGEVFRRLALQKESKVEEGHLMPPSEATRPSRPARSGRRMRPGVIEIELGTGNRVRVDNDVDADALRRVLGTFPSISA